MQIIKNLQANKDCLPRFDGFSFIEKFGVAAYAEQFPKKDIATIVKIKKLYDQKVQAGGYIRFDEQISLAVWLLERFPGVQKRYKICINTYW